MLRSELLRFMGERGIPVQATDALRIAVVDDDPLVVRALTRVLRRIVPDADLRNAQDGFSAGMLVASFRPALVFLDIVMPGLSGVDVCQHIKSTPELERTAVVILSGHLTKDLCARLRSVGADRFIAKPFSANDIRAAVGDLVTPSAMTMATTAKEL